MQYTTTIPDAGLYGIKAAREAHNAALPATLDGKPHPEALANDSAYLDYVLTNAVQSWCQQYAAITPPVVPVVEIEGIPQIITKRQGRAQLKLDGLLAPVEAYIGSLPLDNDLRMTYEDSTDWHRTSGSVVGMLSMLGKSVADADAFFAAAAKL